MLRNIPIRRKLISMLMLTSGAVLLLTCAAFATYELLTFRRTMVRQLSTLGEIVAANSTAALTFQNPDDAQEILHALQAEPHIREAVLYDAAGRPFAHYPAPLSVGRLPSYPAGDGFRFEADRLVAYLPVTLGSKRIGTLYIESDLEALYERLRLYAMIVALVLATSFLVAYLIARSVQRQLSAPILSLAETARAISERRDFSVRAKKAGDDEIGRLTDAFNDMLGEIHRQHKNLRESEARVRAMLDSALSAVFVVDAAGCITDWNTRAEKMFGWSRAEAQGRDLALLIFPESSRVTYALEVARNLERVAAAGADAVPAEIAHTVELAAIRRGGEGFPAELAIGPLPGDGAAGTLCGFITDITERKLAESEIRGLHRDLERRVIERTAELELANKELESFSYSVSHDLRAPLRHVNGFATMLQQHSGKLLDEKGLRYLTTIVDSAKRMGQLIDDLLGFSRMGRAEMSRGTVNLDALVKEVRERLIIDPARVIEWSIQPLPAVTGDVAMLRQVLTNLLDNAVKYSRPRPVAHIEVASRVDTPGEVTIWVRDDGAGFDMRYVGKLFGVFQRLHRANEFEGTGVGLASVQRIVNRHGGRVWAESELGKGATFYFTLPLAARSSASPSPS